MCCFGRHCEKSGEHEERKCPLSIVWKAALAVGAVYAVFHAVKKHCGGLCKKCKKAACQKLEEE